MKCFFFFLIWNPLRCCWKTYLTWAVIPLLLALSLVVNSFPQARYYMTRGGQNAMLTEEGFKHTAAWRDSGEVMKFVSRLLKDDMKATLKLGEKHQNISPKNLVSINIFFFLHFSAMFFLISHKFQPLHFLTWHAVPGELDQRCAEFRELPSIFGFGRSFFHVWMNPPPTGLIWFSSCRAKISSKFGYLVIQWSYMPSYLHLFINCGTPPLWPSPCHKGTIQKGSSRPLHRNVPVPGEKWSSRGNISGESGG